MRTSLPGPQPGGNLSLARQEQSVEHRPLADTARRAATTKWSFGAASTAVATSLDPQQNGGSRSSWRRRAWSPCRGAAPHPWIRWPG